MANFHGSFDNLYLFTEGEQGVVVDTSVHMIIASGHSDMLIASRNWVPGTSVDAQADTLAALGLASTSDSITAAAENRGYTIPRGVQEEAKKALEWRKEHNRGGTSVGLNSARTLAKGGQIGIKKLRHVAKYFPRHEVDKKGQGWSPSEDGFPSNGRIAWALWGGDAGQRWASSIVEREDQKAITASTGVDTAAFEAAYSLEDELTPEFIARVWLDGSGMDRLYKIDLDGRVYMWDDSLWDDLGHDHQDIWNYDRMMDGDVDLDKEVVHLTIDVESAIFIAARFAEFPHDKVTIEDIDANEATLVQSALSEIDWEFIDQTLLAAGEAPPESATDGNYTPDERSKNASAQVRDKLGLFAKSGSRVMVGGDTNLQGKITNVNPSDGTVNVQLDNGKNIRISSKQVEAPTNAPVTIPGRNAEVNRVDTSGILGEPRVPINKGAARIPGTLPAMTSKDLQGVITDFPAWVKSQRDSFSAARKAPQGTVQGKNSLDLGPRGTSAQKSAGKSLVLDAYQHPLLKNFLKGTDSLGYKNSMWFNPLTAAVEGSKAPKNLTPDTTDVQPIYMAVVDPDDPQAVLNLISLVPASDESTEPMTYSRQEGKWVRDIKTLADLNSPTPPPVVPLDSDTLNDVLEQVDQSQSVTASLALTVLFGNEPLVAAGGADRNRGGADALRRYWTRGAGAAKIRWGTPGDWTRCVRNLTKYMGPRSKGYCALRHKEMNGVWPGDKRNTEMSYRDSTGRVYSSDVLRGSEEINTLMFLSARRHDAVSKVNLISGRTLMSEFGYSPEEDLTEEDIQVLSDSLTASAAAESNEDKEAPEGYHYMPDGELMKDSAHDSEASTKSRTISQTPAPKKDNVKGSDRNKKGSAGTGASVSFTASIEKALSNKVSDHNEKAGNGRKANVRTLKAVYRRGAGAFSTSHRPGQNRNSWAMARVNAYLHLLKTGSPKNKKYTTDNDLLPASHPRSSKSEASTMVAGGQVLNGAKFTISLVIPEEMESGDGRKFKKDSISMRDLPLPLLWQMKTGSGHDGSVVVGRIDQMQRVENGIGNAQGVFDSGIYGQEAERLVRHGFLRGVSADMDRFEAEEVATNDSSDDEEKNKSIKKDKIVINAARIMAVTIVSKPAFQECSIQLMQEYAQDSQEETMDIPDGIYVEDIDPQDAEAIVASGMIANAIPVTPPAEWFTDPQLAMATPLSIDDDGHVFGHIAAWDTDHIGLPFGTRPPRSRSKYGYFHTGVCRTESGKDIPVGQLTLAGGHASINASAAEAVKHYDDTASAIADVHAGEDSYGIWVAGALRPGTTPEQIRALRASAPSGDWRPVRGSLELVAVCQVNVPGFPIARARVASGQIMALVAAGASTLAKMRHNPIEELSTRLDRLEMPEKQALIAASDSAKARFAAMRPATVEAEVVVAHGFYDEVEPRLVSVLEQLLADTVAYSFRARGYHWNVKGQDFAQYHELFLGVYDSASESVDPMAENILKLGFDTPFNISTFSGMSGLSTSSVASSDVSEMASDLYEATEYMITQNKNAFQVADSCNEQGVANFLAEQIDMHSKWAWQLKSSVTNTEDMKMLSDESEEESGEESGEESHEKMYSAEAVVASADDLRSRIAEFAARQDDSKKA
jgi:DNA-binding ferritin-like protein